MKNEIILIIGGSGSLGNKLVERYLKENTIYVYSRDESKHWKMNIDYNSDKNLNFLIGNIRDINKIEQTLLRIQPTIIIMAAAMKHIDKCEYESNECILTNIIGTQNVLSTVEKFEKSLKVKTVCFISTDKACSPVNIYGMSKAVSECLMVEKSKFVTSKKFVTVRYGNVLNSRGSIIPTLHEIGKNEKHTHYRITDKRMTRFVMTLDQSVDLIEHSIKKAESGDIVISKLISCNIIDLIEIFSEKYNKPIVEANLRPGEKMLESLINETQSMRLETGEDGYTYIKPSYKNTLISSEIKDYNSKINPLSKDELKEYLKKLDLL
jgi:UDP-N-acetylglucosamine 4,6-dehydratase/5-epimerase